MLGVQRSTTAKFDVAQLREATNHGAARLAGPFDFAQIYDAWFEHVARWIHALGAPPADTEDLTQEVFLVVRRRLPDFDGRNLPAWLYRIASRQVWQHRRLRWIKKVILSRNTVNIEDVADDRTSAAGVLETKERSRLLELLLSKLSEKRRVVFVMFEVDGYTGEEIADTLDVPINTVWTRLHHARKDFFALLAQHERALKGDGQCSH
jgi:RNA polymerase sigma-70 factor (ECF subfamily)